MRILLKAATAALGAMLVSNILLAGSSNPPPPQPITCTGGNAVTAFSYGTLPTCGTPIAGGTINTGAAGQLTDYSAATAVSPITTGTGVVTALGVNAGSAGAFVVNGGALGTPSAGTLTNATGLPVSTGISGLGTGIATALAVNAGSAGSPVINGGVLGTPSSGSLTNLTGLPLSTGVTGILAIANGGTGTTTPGLVAGSNVTITGTWPNQTVASSGGGSGLTVGTSTITSGTTGRLFYDNAGVLGEAVVGSGLSLSAGTLTATGSGATTGYGVDGGTTASSVTGTGTIPNAARLVKVATGWATGTLTLPAISAVSSDTCIRIEDGGNFIDGTHTLTLKGGVSDGLNGGAANGTVGPFTTPGSFLVACVSATNNWNVGPGSIAPSSASSTQIVSGVDVNGLTYGTVAAGIKTFWATPTSANLAAALTDETGTGAAVFASSPALTGTPTLGANGGAVGAIKLFGNTSGDATITVPAAAGTATKFQLPATNGANTNVLQTDGTGVTSWAAAGGGVTVAAGTNVTISEGSPCSSGTCTINSSGGGSSVAPFPQGRLTLQTSVPVMTADQTAKTTIYYDSYQGNLYPNWNGSAMANVTITADEISMGLDAVTPQIALGSLYDVFGTSAATLCAGPAWSSTTARGTGAGTTELQLKLGVWTNKNSLTNCWGGASGTTNRGAIAANQGTYLGTFYATANGQTGVMLAPAAAAGGANNIVGLFNGYNRVPVSSLNLDNTASWTYTPGTAPGWQQLNHGATGSGSNNRVTWVDGLAVVNARFDFDVGEQYTGGATAALTGVDIDSTSAAPTNAGIQQNVDAQSLHAATSTPPLLGLHFGQAMQAVSSSNVITWYGAANATTGQLEALTYQGSY